jgi:hypothetical protein
MLIALTNLIASLNNSNSHLKLMFKSLNISGNDTLISVGSETLKDIPNSGGCICIKGAG